MQFFHINVQRNIEFGLRKENLSKDEMQQRVSNALKMVQLEGYENRYSNHYQEVKDKELLLQEL